MELLDLFQRFGLALGIGLLIGVERGWRTRADAPGSRTAGVRTYTLSGLLGALAGALAGQLGGAPSAGGGILIGLAFATYGAIFATFKFREAKADGTFSVTGVVAGLVAFALGAYALLGDVRVAAAGGVATAAVLAARERLHAWVAQVTWAELRSGLVLLGMTFLALPLVPHLHVGPWGGIDLREVWLVAIVLASVGFAGYVAVKYLGTTRGTLVAAAAGGLVSSTAVTLAEARRARAGEGSPGLHAAAALAAGAVSLARTFALFAVLSPKAALAALPALGPGAVAALVAAGLMARAAVREPGVAAPALGNPFALRAVIGYAVALALIVYAARVATSLVGAGAVLAVAALAGLADLDAATLSMASLARDGLAAATAAQGVAAAAGANILAKAAIGAALGGRAFAGRFLAGSAAMLAAGAAGLWLAG